MPCNDVTMAAVYRSRSAGLTPEPLDTADCMADCMAEDDPLLDASVTEGAEYKMRTATPVGTNAGELDYDDEHGEQQDFFNAASKESPFWHQSSMWSSIFTSWNVTIGLGILALPRAFSRVGFVTGSIMMVCCTLMCMMTFMMLSRAMRETGHYTFGGVMRATSGRAGSLVTDLIISAFMFGVMVVYNQVVAEIVVNLLQSMDLLDADVPLSGSPYFDNRRLFVIIVGIGVFWPLSLLPSLDFLRYISLGATLAMCYVVGLVFYRLVEAVQARQSTSISNSHRTPPFFFSKWLASKIWIWDVF